MTRLMRKCRICFVSPWQKDSAVSRNHPVAGTAALCMCCLQIGHELDQLERQMLDPETAAAAGQSSNLDESGMFSIQVLTKALQVNLVPRQPTFVAATLVQVALYHHLPAGQLLRLERVI